MNPELTPLVAAYNQARGRRPGEVLCHAPSSNLNFAQNGDVRVCCYNLSFVLGRYPQNSLESIWNGGRLRELRTALEADNLSRGCDLCREQLVSRNFGGLKTQFYDTAAQNELETELPEYVPVRNRGLGVVAECTVPLVKCPPVRASIHRGQENPDDRDDMALHAKKM